MMTTEHVAQTSSDVNDPLFPPDTLGALIRDGANGWTRDYSAALEGAVVYVARSSVNIERQRCACVGMEDKTYVRVALDIGISRDGVEHIRHVEELFPGHVLDVLRTPLDEQAPERVGQVIAATLLKLDEEHPVGNLLDNCIAPMRLYEPLLNSLLPPNQDGTMAQWMGEHLSGLLCDPEGTLVGVNFDQFEVQVCALDVTVQNDLRASGEVKLVGDVRLKDRRTGQTRGKWKSRVTLMKPSLQWRELPAPSEHTRAQLNEAIEAWRSELARNLVERLKRGAGPIMLRDVLPHRSLDEHVVLQLTQA